MCVCVCARVFSSTILLVTAGLSPRSGYIFHKVMPFWPFCILPRGQFTVRDLIESKGKEKKDASEDSYTRAQKHKQVCLSLWE